MTRQFSTERRLYAEPLRRCRSPWFLRLPPTGYLVGCASFHAEPVLLCDTFASSELASLPRCSFITGEGPIAESSSPLLLFSPVFPYCPLPYLLAEMGPRRRPSVSDVCRQSFLWTVLLLWLTSCADGTWKTGLYKPYSAGTQAAAAAAAHASVYQRK